VEKIAEVIEPLVERTDLTVAVMGCIVNGVGEGRHADIGVAGTKQKAVIFESGRIVKTIPPDTIVDELVKLIEQKKRSSPKA
jgi:(E)-4-hydroxy-3-methylbut-2-enyl-diphosphate synthase